MIKKIQKELRQLADPARARLSQRYFKTGPGGYAEGDLFLGLTMPNQRSLIKKYWQVISMDEARELLHGKFHEERMLALLILAAKFAKGDELLRKEIFDLYLANTKFINNWDLVDVTAPKIVGAYLHGKNTSILIKLAKSRNMWERRIAILATFHFIGIGQPDLALEIGGILVNDKEDLIHKAVGWMLREIGRPRASLAGKAGKRCGRQIEEGFLDKHYKTMPRTMLRYAIERFPEDRKRHYMGKGKF